MAKIETWPPLPFEQAKPTWETLQLWTQIVGKIRLAQTPWLNHSWHVPLYVTVSGLSTGPIPYGERIFQIDMDFQKHRVIIRTADHEEKALHLLPRTVADFFADIKSLLFELELLVKVNEIPNEVQNPIPFSQDTTHCTYDKNYANRLWRVLLQSDRLFRLFRTGFLGKSSQVHFFWGSFDLAVTRFSGRQAPLHPGGIPNLPDAVTREAYSHEVSSAGFWPGGGPIDYAAFYSYAYPIPEGFAGQPVRPAAAFYSQEAGEFILPYDAVRTDDDPDATLLEFLTSTYEAAATTAKWDRRALECAIGEPRVVRAL
jgi:hypothetical protein